MRARPLALAALAVLPLLLAPLPQSGAETAPEGVDLGGPLAAGQFRAARVVLTEPGGIQVGGVYGAGIATQQPMLPLMAVLRTATGWDMGVYFTYDFSMFQQPAALALQLQGPTGAQHLGNAVQNNVRGGGWSTWPELPAGEYVLVVATAPGAGTAQVRMATFGPSHLVAMQEGTSFFARGLDHSAVGYDLHAQAQGGQGYARAWGYTGAEVPYQVEGRLFAYVGYHQGVANWVSPGGIGFPSGLVDGEAGTWTASFPSENWEGPVCLRNCALLGDSREDPPMAIGADVEV
jgi:hypothetical protein